MVHRLIDEHQIGVNIRIVEDRIDKVQRRESKVYGIGLLKQDVEYIMDQYIYQGSEYCVNISSFTRLNLTNTFHDLKNGKMNQQNTEKSNVVQYVTLFDKALENIINLMKTDSLWRFYRTKEYKMMVSDA